jgi:hypothetical protein
MCHVLAGNEPVFAMAGHSVFCHADTEADFCLLPKLSTNVHLRSVTMRTKANRIAGVDIALRRPLLLQIPLLGVRFIYLLI